MRHETALSIIEVAATQVLKVQASGYPGRFQLIIEIEALIEANFWPFFYFLDQPRIANAVTSTAQSGSSATLTCNTNRPVNWFKTTNKEENSFNFVDLADTGKYAVVNQNLEIKNLQLSDDEYYACAFNDSNFLLTPVSVFYVYVKGLFKKKIFSYVRRAI